jgi:hypothetical protein
MRVLTREWYNVSRSKETVFRLQPIGDIHLGAAACDEPLLGDVVKRVAADPDRYWIGMGDYCEWINVRDPRFDFGTLADWVDVADLVDLAGAQRDRLLSILKPIAGKCLGLVKGNHEDTIHRHTERDIYSELVTTLKGWGGFDNRHQLGFGFTGWLRMLFYWGADKRGGSTRLAVNVHHGYTGGRLGGGKALNMERRMWVYDADLFLVGHSHNTDAYRRAVEGLDRHGRLVSRVRRGAYTGTFLQTENREGPATYSERKGHLPLPIGGVEVELRPGMDRRQDMVRVMV